MGKLIDLTGKRFGRLVVISRAENGKHNKVSWECLCDCGKKTIVVSNCLTRKQFTKSCGCFHRESVTKHGKSFSKEYKTWLSMHQRCKNHKHASFKKYGGRGISVCNHWNKFENFLKDMGNKSGGLTLERIDNNGNYEPLNCKWATPSEQNCNKRLSSRNKIGTNGVSFHRRDKKYVAYISLNKQNIHLGNFDNLFDAVCARKLAEVKYWGKSARV